MYDNLYGALPYANAIDLSSAMSSLAAMGMAGHMVRGGRGKGSHGSNGVFRLGQLHTLPCFLQACDDAVPPPALLPIPQPAATAGLVDAMAGRLAQLLAPPTAPGQGPAAPASPSSSPPRHQPQQPAPAPVSEASDQSLSTSLWAVAVMGYLTPQQPQPPTQQRARGLHSSGAAAPGPASAAAPAPGGVEALWEAAVGQLRSRLADPQRPAPGLAPAALAVTLWAAAAGGRALPAAITGLLWGRAGGAALHAFDPNNLATLVGCVARGARWAGGRTRHLGHKRSEAAAGGQGEAMERQVGAW